MANAEIELYQILATAAPCIYLSVAIAEKKLYIPEPYPWFHSEKCKPCPVALVPTLGCSRPLPPSLLLLASALPGDIIPGYVFFVLVKTVLTFGPAWLHRKENINTLGQPRPQKLLLLARRAAVSAARERRPIYLCLHPLPRAHVEFRGRNGPGRRAPEPHANPIRMCTAATTAVCCCFCCCCAAAAEANLVRAVAATAAVLRLVKWRAIFYEQNNEEQNIVTVYQEIKI